MRRGLFAIGLKRTIGFVLGFAFDFRFGSGQEEKEHLKNCGVESLNAVFEYVFGTNASVEQIFELFVIFVELGRGKVDDEIGK